MLSLYEIRYGGRLIDSVIADSEHEALEKALRRAQKLGHYRDVAPYIMGGEVSRVDVPTGLWARELEWARERDAANKTGTKRTVKRSSNRAGAKRRATKKTANKAGKRRNRSGMPKRSARTGRFLKAR